jgi:AcrR family transcriptional regulator
MVGTMSDEPKRRGQRPSKQLDDVVTAALRVLDREGAKGFSMRLLASELGDSAMTAYNYVPSKALLLDMVIDSVIDRIVPPERTAAWDDELRRYARDAYRIQVRHAWLPVLLASEHIVNRPAQRRARRALLDLFRRAGADDAAAHDSVGAFYALMVGSIALAAPTRRTGGAARATAGFESALEILIAGLQVSLATPADAVR